jgi:hypothetical protein
VVPDQQRAIADDVFYTHYKRSMGGPQKFQETSTATAEQSTTMPEALVPGSESDPDWIPVFDAITGDVGSTRALHPGFSTGDSDNGDDSNVLNILSEVGNYCFGPLNEKDSAFANRYADNFWHARSWRLHPRQTFSGPPAGIKIDIGDRIPTPLEIFTWMWTERLQRKIVKESNKYAALKDGAAAQVRDGPLWKRRITLGDFRKWCGIYAFMAVRCQPSVRDFWSVQSDALYCEDVSSTMSRNRFQFILSSLHLVPKGSIVKDRGDSSYDPIAHIRWMMEELIENFNAVWNTSS